MKSKTWLSPFVTITFVIISVTGVLLFFHVKNGPIMALHEWFGWLFVVAGLVHVLLNIRPLLSYLKRPAALASIAVALVIGVFLTIGGVKHEGENRRRGPAPESGQVTPAAPSTSAATP